MNSTRENLKQPFVSSPQDIRLSVPAPSDHQRPYASDTVPNFISPSPGTLHPTPTQYSVPHHQNTASPTLPTTQTSEVYGPNVNLNYSIPSYRTSPARPLELSRLENPQNVGPPSSPFNTLAPPGFEEHAPNSVVERSQDDVRRREKLFELYKRCVLLPIYSLTGDFFFTYTCLVHVKSSIMK